jgi:ABC-type proline/glycine betaine transport system permease subunit
MNNASLLTADRATHLKIVVLSLLCAILIAGIGIASRVTESAADGGIASTVFKPAKPLTAAGGEDRTIR